LAILGLLLLAACQQPAAKAPADTAFGVDTKDIPTDWSAPGEAKESKYFAEEFKTMRARMVVVMFGGCYKEMRDPAALDRCLRSELVETFDDSGQGERYCENQSNIDNYTDCIVLGNVVVDAVRRLDAKVEIDPAVWSGRRGFADFFGKVAVVGAVTACIDAKTEYTATTCMFDWLLAKLDLPEAIAQKCSADLVAEERGTCIGQAATIRFVQDHLSRAGGLST
jgi:hypothetical protein